MMTAKDFRLALAHLDLQQKQLAELTGYAEETISRYARGHRKVPIGLAKTITAMLDQAQTHPMAL